jgi:hypothetical protein
MSDNSGDCVFCTSLAKEQLVFLLRTMNSSIYNITCTVSTIAASWEDKIQQLAVAYTAILWWSHLYGSIYRWTYVGWTLHSLHMLQQWQTIEHQEQHLRLILYTLCPAPASALTSTPTPTPASTPTSTPTTTFKARRLRGGILLVLFLFCLLCMSTTLLQVKALSFK